MHTVMWTFKVPSGTSKDSLRETIKATAHTYQGIPGLIRKYYGIAEDGKSLVGIYLWESRAAAEKLYTQDWVVMVTKRWTSAPMRREWEAPMVSDNAEKRLVEAA
ncbi:MAG: YdhR family protein [Proteobacteria bacterium]|nr:YdhR family protein [Pseudomonadota bacterium]